MLQTFEILHKKLRDILLYSYRWISLADPYPLCILPRKKYVLSVDVGKILEDGVQCVLVRRSEVSLEETWNMDTNTLREDAIDIFDVPSMSMNLLGTYFDVEHIKYVPLGEARDDWKGDFVTLYDFRDKYSKKAGAPIFFLVESLHNKTYPFQRAKDSVIAKLIHGLKMTPNNNGKYNFEGSTEIRHAPTNLNYWHVEFLIKDHEGKAITKTKAAWQQSAASMAFAQLITGSARSHIPNDLIRSKYYHQKFA